MLLYFIRHGEPDYVNDTLTPYGILQAEETAKRLLTENMTHVYASPMGRAQLTAHIFADKAGLPVETLDWAHELGGESKTTFPDGKSKGMGIVSPVHFHSKENLAVPFDDVFDTIPGICDTEFKGRYRFITDGLDKLLSEHGYEREENGAYRLVCPEESHIAVFCHGAMIRSVVAHLLHIPYQYIASTFHEHHCGITLFRFEKIADETDEIVPQLLSFGDAGILYNLGVQHFYLTGEEI